MILRLCDPAQLSSLCEVSYLFLVRASSLLYREIRLNGRQATKLFGRRVSTSGAPSVARLWLAANACFAT